MDGASFHDAVCKMGSDRIFERPVLGDAQIQGQGIGLARTENREAGEVASIDAMGSAHDLAHGAVSAIDYDEVDALSGELKHRVCQGFACFRHAPDNDSVRQIERSARFLAVAMAAKVTDYANPRDRQIIK
jgi:hypothetical protein